MADAVAHGVGGETDVMSGIPLCYFIENEFVEPGSVSLLMHLTCLVQEVIVFPLEVDGGVSLPPMLRSLHKF